MNSKIRITLSYAAYHAIRVIHSYIDYIEDMMQNAVTRASYGQSTISGNPSDISIERMIYDDRDVE